MAARFWVGGTGTWDASDTTHWAAVTNGSGGQSVPGASDTVTFDGASGVGAVVSLAYSPQITSIKFTDFQGTFNAGAYNITAARILDEYGPAHTINMGSGTWTLTGAGATAVWNVAGANLTLNCETSTILMNNTTNWGVFSSDNGLVYNIITISKNGWELDMAAGSSLGYRVKTLTWNTGGGGSGLYGNNIIVDELVLNIAGSGLAFTAGNTTYIKKITHNASVGNTISFSSATPGSGYTLDSLGNNISLDYFVIQDATVRGGYWFATNSTNTSGNHNWSWTSPIPSPFPGIVFPTP